MKFNSNFLGSMSYVSGLGNNRLERISHAEELEIVASSLFYGVDRLDLVALWAETLVTVGEVVGVPALTVFYPSGTNRTWTMAVMTSSRALSAALAVRITCC